MDFIAVYEEPSTCLPCGALAVVFDYRQCVLVVWYVPVRQRKNLQIFLLECFDSHLKNGVCLIFVLIYSRGKEAGLAQADKEDRKLCLLFKAPRSTIDVSYFSQLLQRQLKRHAFAGNWI